MSTEAALIKLPFINGRTLTFSSTDYMKIREQHRIVGKLIGVPVTHSRKASCYSLPAYYNENETKLMLDEGIAVLVDKNQLKKAPSEIVKLEYEEHQKRVVEELQKPYIESKLEATRINMEHIIKGKIIKLVKSGVATEGIDINPENILKDEALRIKNSLGAKSICLQIPTQHPFQDNSSQLVSDYYVVSNPQKYKVFRDLWNKGFFITNGSSFGCDFLTYPGSPMHYHASQTVHVVDADINFDVKFFISSCRLAVSVHKKCVFAYVNGEDRVMYQTFTWDNPRLRQLYSAKIIQENNSNHDAEKMGEESYEVDKES